MSDNQADRRVLRELAKRVRDLAADPVMADRRARWQRHNALRVTRPLVSVSPEGSWPELIGDDQRQCQTQPFRRWEWRLRSTIYLAESIGDDSIVSAEFNIGWQIDRGSLGVEIPRTVGDNRGSFIWDPPIKDLDADFDKLTLRQPTVDREATLRQLALAESVFGDLLTCRVRGVPLWSVGMTQDAAYLVGLEQLMYAMMDQPQAVHRLMQFLQADMAHFLDFLEAENLLNANHDSNHVGSGGGGFSTELDGNGWAGRWGFCESQETVGISPAMFSEFVLPYQAELTHRFGLNYYGCCEQLEHRMDSVIAAIPRLRRVSVAPKANQAMLAEKLAGNYVYCRKADPVPVCVEFSEPTIRADIRHTLDVAGDAPLEIILKDTHTVQGQPWRFGRWVEIVREEIAKDPRWSN